MKKLSMLLLAGLLALCFCACGGTEDADNAEATENTVAESEMTYESIYKEYSQKIIDAVPGLVEEYNTEAAEKAGDVNALAELSTEKVQALADISTEGTEKMAELKLKNGDSDDVYMEWANKLNDVYMEQSKQITDAYMSTATGQ